MAHLSPSTAAWRGSLTSLERNQVAALEDELAELKTRMRKLSAQRGRIMNLANQRMTRQQARLYRQSSPTAASNRRNGGGCG